MEQEQILESQKEQILKEARKVAFVIKEASEGRKWFKPVHIKRKIKGENEGSIRGKLDILVSLNLAVKKKEEGSDFKYMLTIDNENKLAYLEEVKEYLEGQLKDIKREIKELKKV